MFYVTCVDVKDILQTCIKQTLHYNLPIWRTNEVHLKSRKKKGMKYFSKITCKNKGNYFWNMIIG